VQHKVNNERFPGVDSDSEEYEVDDHGQVEQQMKELGVNVTVHPSMLEDFAIQSAAVGIPPPLAVTSNDTGQALANTLTIVASRVRKNEPATARPELDMRTTDGTEDEPWTSSGSMLTPRGTDELPNGSLDMLSVLPAGASQDPQPPSCNVQQEAIGEELHPAQPITSTAPGLGFTFSDAFGASHAPQPVQTKVKNLEIPLNLGSHPPATRSAEGECAKEPGDGCQDATPVCHHLAPETVQTVGTPQPDASVATSGDTAASGEDLVARRCGELPRIMLRPRRSARADQPDYVESPGEDQSPPRESPRKPCRKGGQTNSTSARCDTLHNTLVQAHNAGAFQTTLSNMGVARSVRAQINAGMLSSQDFQPATLQPDALVEISNAIMSAKWLAFAAAKLGADLPDPVGVPGGIHGRLIPLLFSHEMDCMAMAQDHGFMEFVNTALGLSTTPMSMSQMGGNCVREESLFAAVAHATAQQKHSKSNCKSPVQHTPASTPVSQLRRTRTRPIRPPQRSQDMISFDEDIDVVKVSTPKRRGNRNRPLQWARKRVRTGLRAAASLATASADTLSEHEDELHGAAGLLELANASANCHTADCDPQNVSPYPQHLSASNLVGGVGTTSTAVLDPALFGLPAFSWTPSSLPQGLGTADSYAQQNEQAHTQAGVR
jgi:hypothetical protein